MVLARFGVAARERDPVTTRALRPVRIVAAAVAAAYLVALGATVFGVSGLLAVAAAGGQSVFLAGLTGVLLLRARATATDRASWLLLAAGVAAYFAGSLVFHVVYHDPVALPRPSWCDPGFLAFYPLAWLAVVRLLKARVRRLSAGMLLDGLVTGLTAAAFAAALALGASLRLTGGSLAVVLATAAYP